MPLEFVDRLQEILGRIAGREAANIERAAEAMSASIASDGLVHLYGSGHSVIPVLEVFPRYGGYVGFHPMMDPRLMWSNIVGPGGVRELLWLERTEGYVEQYLAAQPILARDTLIVFSHGGLNAAPVEAALYGRARGATVIAITAVENLSRPATHSSGERLPSAADIVIDTGVPSQDALVDIPGWAFPVGGASTITACVIAQALVVETARKLAERGETPPTFVTPMISGDPTNNERVFEEYHRRLLRAEQQAVME